jgi:hypothetical protein
MKVLHPTDGTLLPISHPVRFDGSAEEGVTSVTLLTNGSSGDVTLGTIPVTEGRWTFLRNFSQKGVRKITAIGRDGDGSEVTRTSLSIDLRLSNEFGYTPPELTLHHLGDIAGLLEIATPIARTFDSLDHVSVLLKLPGNQLYFESNLDLDTDGKEAPGIVFEPTHQSKTSLRYPNGDSLDPNKVPFIVLPGIHSGVDPTKMTLGGMTFALGDIAVVLSGSKIEFAVFGDFGPTGKIGEGSIALHRSLGHETVLPSGRIQDVDIERHVVTIVFPGSGDGMPHTPDVIREKGRALFTALGGVLP